MKIFTSKSTKKHEDDFVLAIGGGGVIDEAKIWAKENGKHVIAVPTTGSGASETTHAVKWGKTKENVECEKPSLVLPPFEVELSKEARTNTCYDILGHLVDYLNVCTDNEVVEVGTYMGRLIEQRPTNLTHPKSYPLTLEKGIPHGRAIGLVIKDCLDEAFPL